VIADGSLFTPALGLILVLGLVMGVAVIVRGPRFIRPAYIVTGSMIGVGALAAWGTEDLVNSQFYLVILVFASVVALAVVSIASMIAIRRGR
jgi:hypothetical protein